MAKYGRLFTFRDVVRLINAMTNEAPDEPLIFDAVVEKAVHDADGEPLTFPPDEPLFLLRGQDKVAGLAVLDYCARARVARGSGRYDEDPFAAAVTEAAEAMREWQAQHPDRVKAPD